MKKLILLVSCVLFTTAVFAQRGWDWGVKVGLNLSTLTKLDDTKMKPSVYAGVFAEFQILDWMTIQPEVVYSRQGYKYSTNNTDYWYRMNYINIPVLAKFYVLDRLSVDVGPQFGILMNARLKQKHDGNKVTTDIDDLKNFDVSFPVGLSYRITNRWDASIRYNIGLTKVMDEPKAKNGVLQIGAGFRF